jgi:hypothetical protein
MSKHKIPISVIALTLVAIALSATTYGAISVNKSIVTNGSINVTPNLGLYSDPACTTGLSSLDWGAITAGNNITKTIYVKNTGTGTSLILSLSTSNWNPTTANGPITISWDNEDTRLSPGQSIEAVITLTSASNIVDITNFSVQIMISGTA